MSTHAQFPRAPGATQIPILMQIRIWGSDQHETPGSPNTGFSSRNAPEAILEGLGVNPVYRYCPALERAPLQTTCDRRRSRPYHGGAVAERLVKIALSKPTRFSWNPETVVTEAHRQEQVQ
jgi:hypothetical protein